MKIFVTVGTHEQPFQRLLDAVSIVAASIDGVEWTVQYGVGEVSVPHARLVQPYLTHDEVTAACAWADVVVSHASPGAVFDALYANAQPLVWPRRHANHEHVNDHQVAFAHRAALLGLAWIAEDATCLERAVRALSLEATGPRSVRLHEAAAASRARTESFVATFRCVMEDLWLDRGPTAKASKRSVDSHGRDSVGIRCAPTARARGTRP